MFRQCRCPLLDWMFDDAHTWACQSTPNDPGLGRIQFASRAAASAPNCVAKQRGRCNGKGHGEKEGKTGGNGGPPGRPGGEGGVEHGQLLQQPEGQDRGERGRQGGDEQTQRTDGLVLELATQDGVTRWIGCVGNHGQPATRDGPGHHRTFEFLAQALDL